MTPVQCRGARGLVNMSMAQLAAAAVVPAVVIFDFEGEFGRPKPEDLTALQGALERAGVEFTNGGQPGVRLRAPGGTIPADQLNASNDE